MSIGTDDEVTEFDEPEPNFVRIENAADNFVLDINFDVEAKEAYAQFQTTAKEENKLYEETTFGKYNGYYQCFDLVYDLQIDRFAVCIADVDIHFSVHSIDINTRKPSGRLCKYKLYNLYVYNYIT